MITTSTDDNELKLNESFYLSITIHLEASPGSRAARETRLRRARQGGGGGGVGIYDHCRHRLQMGAGDWFEQWMVAPLTSWAFVPFILPGGPSRAYGSKDLIFEWFSKYIVIPSLQCSNTQAT